MKRHRIYRAFRVMIYTSNNQRKHNDYASDNQDCRPAIARSPHMFPSIGLLHLIANSLFIKDYDRFFSPSGLRVFSLVHLCRALL